MPSIPTPLDPVQQRLTDLRNGLLRLHKTLLDSERDFYEHEIGKIASANQLLALVINDPWFAWLHQISELVVLIDETQESKEPPPTAELADLLVARTRALLVPAEEGSDFAQRYYQAMQRDPGVVIAHGQMVKLLGTLGT